MPNDPIAERSAREIAVAIEPELELYPPLSWQRRDKIAAIAIPIITAEYADTLKRQAELEECLREALKYKIDHAAYCMTIHRKDGECNCWVSRAQKLLEGREEYEAEREAELDSLRSRLTAAEAALTECQKTRGSTYGADWHNWKLAEQRATAAEKELAEARQATYQEISGRIEYDFGESS